MNDLTTITKKQFFNQLINNSSKLLLTKFFYNYNIEQKDILFLLHHVNKKNNLNEFNKTFNNARHVIKVNSNSIQFNNKSYLYFNDVAKSNFYKYNNYMVAVTPKKRADYADHVFIYEVMEG